MSKDIVHNIDQYTAMLRDILKNAPSILKEFHNNLKKEGFDDMESLELTKTTLIRMLGK